MALWQGRETTGLLRGPGFLNGVWVFAFHVYKVYTWMVVPVKLLAPEEVMWVRRGKMVGKNTNILGQLANIGSSKLEANRCQYLSRC